MKRTFRFLTMGLLAVGLLASCNKKENNGGTADGKGFKAITEQRSGNSKTHGVLQSDGTDEWLQVQWTAGDEIKVDNGTDVCVFGLTSGENTNSGEFHAATYPTGYFEAADFYAIYPVVNAEGEANTINGNAATFNLPATQLFDTEHPSSFAEKAMPMTAHSSNQTFQFKNMLGGICFPMVGNGYNVTRIELTSNSNEALWGVCTTTIDANGFPTNTMVSNDASNKNVITLDCGTGVALGNTATEFTIMVPAGTLENGFTVTAYQNSDKVYEKSTETAPGAGFISRNEIRVVNDNLDVVVSNLTVTTISPTHITTNSALGIGSVTGGMPTECGIIYAQASDLTTPATDLVIGGTGVTSLSPTTPATSYDVEMNGLIPDTESNPIVYYVRAWAKNEVGTITYGDPIPFATRKDYANDYNGRMPYPFTVGVGKQVYFSMGNLQYQASTGSWKFAENQFDFIGADNSNVSSSYDGWIDLFGWGTSGWSGSGAVAYQPYSTSLDNTHYYSGGSLTHLTGTNAKADWGVYHSLNTTDPGISVISNGGNYNWRTLQSEIDTSDPDTKEWDYLLNGRSGNYRYAKVQMLSMGRTGSENGDKYNALIVFPDGFNWPTLVRSFECNANTILPALSDDTNHDNQLTEAEWSLLEQQGAVLLPAAGLRRETTMSAVKDFGAYWSSSCNNNYGANTCEFECECLFTCANHYRYYGFAVRVVCPAN